MNPSDTVLVFRTKAANFWGPIGAQASIILVWTWMGIREFNAKPPQSREDWIMLLLGYLPFIVLFGILCAWEWMHKSKQVEVRIKDDRAEVIETSCLGQRRIEVSANDTPALRVHETIFLRNGQPPGPCGITLSARHPKQRKLKFGQGLQSRQIIEIRLALQEALKIAPDKR